jgi:hypothetical protein
MCHVKNPEETILSDPERMCLQGTVREVTEAGVSSVARTKPLLVSTAACSLRTEVGQSGRLKNDEPVKSRKTM